MAACAVNGILRCGLRNTSGEESNHERHHAGCHPRSAICQSAVTLHFPLYYSVIRSIRSVFPAGEKVFLSVVTVTGNVADSHALLSCYLSILQRGDGVMWQLMLKQLPVALRAGGLTSFAPV
jgi:hypothetical protein